MNVLADEKVCKEVLAAKEKSIGPKRPKRDESRDAAPVTNVVLDY
jgi:hypothetical protein